ncbi:ABC transporter ATP-binding protein/permease [Planktothrix agardhii]|uniref:ABC transporter ATP-binding protein/permease n=1 Tax=Planktothrix agardhii TaxID=1160 RepID=UPI001F162370|nr:ATP-binding cassette domain-containing protein [Planktothrix agardhii]MCF3646092.1 ATP-binding cassette domain-containing protein [Planktothrix agardhii 1026]
MNVAEQTSDSINLKEDVRTFNRSLQEFLRFIQVYWYPKEPQDRAFSEIIRSWGMIVLLFFSLVGLVSLNAFNSFVFRDLISVTEAKDAEKLTHFVIIYGITLASMTCFTGLSKFLKKLIALDWYQWINNNILRKYFKNRAYYQINFKGGIENPDQRLSQEIQPIARTTMDFLTTCVEKLMEMLVFIVILWSISKTISIVLLAYTIIGNIIATYINQQLNKVNKQQLEAEGTYKYAITHVRTHAESIAFFRGEEKELNIIQRKFNQVIKIIIERINWERTQDFFNRGYQSMVQIFPFLIVSPLYISGEIEFGQVNQASYCCYFVSTALSVLVDEFGRSGEFINYIERLEGFSHALDTVSEQTNPVSTIKVIEDNNLTFEDVTLQTPDAAKVIVEHLSLSVEPGEGLLIVGPSGRGKSSLLRAISGLWNTGTGDLVRPPLDDILFLPQRPYIILGTLREQLIYPQTTNPISDSELKEILHQVNLQNVLTRIENFDEELPWESILSLGEQQRLAFARLLVNHPNFVILDEATSALDLKNEDNLYKQLQETGKTFISVGHRESLFNYHQKVLEMSEDSSWRLVDIKDYPVSSVLPLNPNNTKASLETVEILSEIDQKNHFSHQEMQKLTRYSLSTIKNKASRGQTIVADDGFTYRYDKTLDQLKWVRI